MRVALLVLVIVALAATVIMAFRGRGYRGAVGFRNRSGSEIASAQVAGFARPIECTTLAPGEHSFNYLGTMTIPAEVEIAWIHAGETTGRTARVSLSAIPAAARDGEIFFVLSPDGAWTVEYAPRLRLEGLQGSPD